MDDISDINAHPFSVIHFFGIFSQAIAKVSIYPLTSANLIMQKDAYARLGAANDDSSTISDEIFASLECGNKTKDSALRFAIAFTTYSIELSIEGLETMYLDYEDFLDEKDASRQLIAVLTMLSNGQIANLVTLHTNVACATETLLYGKRDYSPRVIATSGKYAWWWSKDPAAAVEYDTMTLRNTYIAEKIPVPKNFFLVDLNGKDTPVQKGRLLADGVLTPLTKEKYEFVTQTIFLQGAGQKRSESTWQLLYRSWEFWAVLGILGISIYIMRLFHILPQFALQHPIVFCTNWHRCIELRFRVVTAQGTSESHAS